MRKLILIITTLLISLLLSGCDLFAQEQIDQISEEFCRENPTSEICQGDPVGDIEDGIVIDAFNLIIAEYSDLTNETFCDDYFAITNSDLLELCRTNRNSLVPEDYTDYTIVDVVKKTTLSTEDVYEVNVVSADGLSEITFTIGLIYIEGDMVINLWSYEETIISLQDVPISLEEAQAYFEEFVANYMNSSISSEVICSEYFGSEDEGCAGERDESFAAGFDVTFEGITDLGEGSFEVELGFSDTLNPTPEFEFEEILLERDEEGNIVMSFVDTYELEYLTKEEVFEVMKEFIIDYLDESFSNTQLNNKYFEGTMDIEFFNKRDSDLLKGITMEVLSVNNPHGDDNYAFLEATIRRIEDGVTDEAVIEVKVKDFEDGTYYVELIFDDYGETYLDINQTKIVFEQFILDYMNPTITFDQLNEMYFDYTMDIGFQDDRLNDQAEGATFVILSVVDPYPEDPWSYLDVELEITIGTDIEVNIVPIRITEFGDGTYYIDLMFGDGGQDYDLLFEFIEKLLVDYQNPAITDDDVCYLYFEGEQALDCSENRQAQLTDVTSIELVGLYFYDNHYEVEFLYYMNDSTTETQFLFVNYYFNDNNELKIEFFDGSYNNFPWDEAYNHIYNYVNDFNNFTVDSTIVCSSYFEGWAYDECVMMRDQSILNNIHIGNFNMWEEYGHYIVEFEFMDEFGGIHHEKFYAYFHYDEFNYVYVEFSYYDYVDFPWDDAWNHINALVNDFNDFSLDSTYVCTLYFGDNDLSGCIDKRDGDIMNNVHIQGFTLFTEGNTYVIEFIFEDNLGNTWNEKVYAEFYYDESNQVLVKFLDDHQHHELIPWQDAWDFLLNYQNVFNDLGYPTNDLCSEYFGESSYQYCVDRREDAINNDVYIVINELYEMDGMYFVVIEYYSTVNGYQYTEVGMLYFFNDDMNNLRMDIDLNIRHEVDYDEAFNHFNQFIQDFLNPNMSTGEFCYKYFPWQDSTNCIWDREGLDLSYMVITVDYFEKEYGEYEIGITFTDTQTNISRSEIIFVNFYYDELNEIRLDIFYTVNGNYVDFVTASGVFTSYVSDYMNPSFTFQDINSMYFDGRMDFNFEDMRIFDLDNGITYTIISITDPNDGNGTQWIRVELEVNDNGSTSMMLVWMKVFLLETGNYLIEFDHMDYEQPVISFNEAYLYLEVFVSDWNDFVLTSDYVCSIYFDAEEYQGCLDRRENDMTLGQYVVLQNLDQFPDGFFVDFGYFNDNDDFLYNEFIPVYFYYDMDDNLKMKFHYDNYQGPYLEYDEAFAIMNGYFDDYMNPAISSSDFCATYHEMWMIDECIVLREELFANNEFAEMDDFRIVDYYYYVVTMGIYDSNGIFLYSMDFDVEFYENYGTIYINLHAHYYPEDPLTHELRLMVEGFFIAYADLTIPSTDVCSLVYDDPTNCIAERDQLIADGLVYVDLWDFYYHYDEADLVHYYVNVYYEFTSGNYEIREYEVMFSVNPDLSFELNLMRREISVPSDAVLLNEAETIIVLTQFALDYADTSMSNDDFCNLYFGGTYDGAECIEGRQEFQNDLGTAVFSYLEVALDTDGVEYYMAYFDMVIEGVSVVQDGPFRVYQLTNGNYFIEFVKMPYYPNPE